MLFSHGWPLNADSSEVQMVLLASNGYRCIAHDRRGHGRSSQPWNGNEMDTYAHDLSELIETLDLKHAVLVGFSPGGGEVARYIGNHGTKRVAKAALIADGSVLAADGQLAGTPSVLFDAVAVILSDEGVKTLSMEIAAIDFVCEAFGHLKAIAVDTGGQALLRITNVGQDAGVVDANDKDAFVTAARTRQWDREKSVRILA